ncbi:MAG: helix-turn-helix domain-containing protein [Cyanophyceae cyanobacterium]
MNELIDKVVYKIRKDKLKHKSRKREFINKRMYLYYLLKEHDYSYTDIGKLFNKNHATIIHGCRQYRDLKKSKDVGLMNDLVEYYSFFQPYELQNIKFLIKDDVANANSLRELQRIKKRLERELYVDIKK